MNCEMFQEQIVPYLEDMFDAATADELQNHLANCPACQAEAQACRALHERLTTAGHTETALGTNLSQTVMDQILLQQVLLTRRLIMRRRIRIFGVSGLAAVLFIGLIWTALQHGPTTALAAEPLARGVEAASNLNAIHLKVRMRTPPADNFESINLSDDFVDVDLWKQFSPLKWRVEKPGRVAVMDGKQTLMIVQIGKDRVGNKLNVAASEAFDTSWLHRLAAVDQVLAKELVAITAQGYDVKTEHQSGAGGAAKDVVTVQVNTDDNVGKYLKNKSLDFSDSRRVYTFDSTTHRLENAKFYCRDKGKDVLVLELVKIEYDPVIEDSLFSLADTETVSWVHQPEQLADNDKYEQMTPAETARAIFQACADRNWDEAAKFFSFKLDDRLKKAFGGLTIITIGEPFQAKPYPGWFVPYEIRFADGQVKKFNLALRNDNPAKRYIFDGGL